MNLGLLGTDARIRRIVEAARRRGDILAADRAVTAAAAGWETLLDAGTCDAVLVGTDGWDAGRGDAVRMLVQAGRTLLLSHPLELSMLWAYELDMIRRDSGARIIPDLPLRLHPFVTRLSTAIESGLAGAGGLGAVESMTLERTLGDRSRDNVLRQLARDVDLIRVLAGDPARLGTIGDAQADSAWNSLAVGFSGPAHVPSRWQVARGAVEQLRIVLQHAGGAIEVTLPDDSTQPATWRGDGEESCLFDPASVMVGVLHGEVDASRQIPPADWAAAARAVELAETVPRSLAKGRAIDLHQEEFSELGTFRGTMASLGCGLILAALLVLVIATLVGGIANEFDWQLGKRLAGAWPYLVLTVLGVFLLLQLLPALAGVDRRSESPPGSPPGRRHE
jgi:predicted dehydrogenase